MWCPATRRILISLVKIMIPSIRRSFTPNKLYLFSLLKRRFSPCKLFQKFREFSVDFASQCSGIRLLFVNTVDTQKAEIVQWVNLARKYLRVSWPSFALLVSPVPTVEILPLQHQTRLGLMTTHLQADHFSYEK